jgi:hypothetical protein
MQVEREAPQGVESGVRERNTWFICPQDRDSCGKLQVIPDNISGSNGVIPPEDETASY